jgi:hypothetical protein
MKLILISGDGHGAGKTFLARKLAANQDQMFSIANVIRGKLRKQYPAYDWYNKDPKFKTKTIVKETGLSVHTMLDALGRDTKRKFPLFWAKEIVEVIAYARSSVGLELGIIDDVRFLDEYQFIRSSLADCEIVHFHIVNPKALPEPQYENEQLKKLADYLLSRNE